MKPNDGTFKDKEVGAGFDGKRLRKLQLERARSTLTAIPKEEEASAAFRRWSSLNETTEFKKREGDSPYHLAATNTRGQGHHQPVVYVLPDPKKVDDPEKKMSSIDRFATVAKQEETPKLAYPHGMPRWGPRLVTRPFGPVDHLNAETETNTVGSSTRSKGELNIGSPPPENEANPNFNDHKSKKKDKKLRQRQVIEKAQAQSLLAAVRAISATTSTGPKKQQPETGLSSLQLALGRPSSLLQSARVKQARVINTIQANNIGPTKSLDDDNDDDASSQDGDAQSVESASEDSAFIHNNDEKDSDDEYVSVDDDAASGLGSEDEEEDENNEDDSNDIAATAPSPKRHPIVSTPTKKAALPGWGFFGRTKGSLLQSARVQQSHVIQHNHHHSPCHQTRSLDDPWQQQKPPKTERSVQSFEFPRRDTTKTTTTKREPIVETVESDSSEESDDSTPEQQQQPTKIETGMDSYSKEDQDDNGDHLNDFLSIDDSPEVTSVEEEDPKSDAESQSWSMRSTSSSDDAEEELSIDETIEDSTGFSKEEEEESALSKQQEQPRNPQSFAIPTMILSEVDAGSSSHYSDYSSLAINTSSKDVVGDDEEKFFDAVDDCTRASPSSRAEQRPFDARRCRELLQMRNKYLEQEERKKLLSPQAASRLSSIPSLSRSAEETTLLELATRGRWLAAAQARQATMPLSEPSIISSPFSSAYPRRNLGHHGQERSHLASMPDDDGPSFQPISLVAPTTRSRPVPVVRKEPWHVPSSEDTNEQSDKPQHSSDTAPNTTTTSMIKLRRFLLRCLYFTLFLLWAARSALRLQDTFTSETTRLVGTAGRKAGADLTQLEDVPSRTKTPYANASNASEPLLLLKMTQSSWMDVPILCFDPPPTELSIFLADDTQEMVPAPLQKMAPLLPPQKCLANFTKTQKKFWELKHLGLGETDESITEDMAQTLYPKEVMLPQAPLRKRFVVDKIPSPALCDDDFDVCYTATTSKPWSKLNLNLDANTDFRPPNPEDPNEKKGIPLLKSIGDSLRRRGQLLQEKRRKLREKHQA